MRAVSLIRRVRHRLSWRIAHWRSSRGELLAFNLSFLVLSPAAETNAQKHRKGDEYEDDDDWDDDDFDGCFRYTHDVLWLGVVEYFQVMV